MPSGTPTAGRRRSSSTPSTRRATTGRPPSSRRATRRATRRTARGRSTPPTSTRRGVRRVRRLPLLLLLAAGPLAAQDPVPWPPASFPSLCAPPNTGLMVLGPSHLARQAVYAAGFPFDAILSAEAGGSLH